MTWVFLIPYHSLFTTHPTTRFSIILVTDCTVKYKDTYLTQNNLRKPIFGKPEGEGLDLVDLTNLKENE
jgi:hypothetical protein